MSSSEEELTSSIPITQTETNQVRFRFPLFVFIDHCDTNLFVLPFQRHQQSKSQKQHQESSS
jgi:hypothetical protein